MRSTIARSALLCSFAALLLGFVCYRAALAQTVAAAAPSQAPATPLSTAATSPATPSIDAVSARVLAAAKAAAGGAAWASMRTLHTHYSVQSQGLKGTEDEWADLVSNRATTQSDLGPLTTASGFDGSAFWSQDAYGNVRVLSDEDMNNQMVDDAQMSADSIWYVELSVKSIVYAGTATEGSRKFDVLAITPVHQSQFQAWFDQTTGLEDRIIVPALNATNTVFYEDYRTVAGMKQPFRVRDVNRALKTQSVLQLLNLEVNGSIPDQLLSMPKSPASAFDIAGASPSVTVPFVFAFGYICFDAVIHGHAVLAALDTSAQFQMDAATAKRIHLSTSGRLSALRLGPDTHIARVGRVQDLEIGDMTFHNIPFQSIYLGGFDKRVFVGDPLFAALVVKIDFDKSLLTFTRPELFSGVPGITPTPFRFTNGTIPEVDGSLDGIPCRFAIITGSPNSVQLSAQFIEANHVKELYKSKLTSTAVRFGGETWAGIARSKTATIGQATLPNLVVELSSDKQGLFGDKSIDAVIGNGVLHHFNVTFDYSRNQVYFEPNSKHDVEDTISTDGMIVAGFDQRPIVLSTLPGGAADQAGIRAGDTILVVNGIHLYGNNLDELDKALAQPEGTVVKLTLQSAPTAFAPSPGFITGSVAPSRWSGVQIGSEPQTVTSVRTVNLTLKDVL